jgi:flap endonuclease-1
VTKDVVVYGAPLMRNIATRSGPIVIVHGDEVRTALDMDHRRFIDFALLLGTDFSQRIKRVGPQRALKFIRQHGSIEQVLEHEHRYPPHISPKLYLQQVEVARLVFHTLPPGPDASKLQNGEPDDEAVQEILQKYNLWAELSHNFQWDYSNALSGNYFQDNPAAT